MTGPHEPVNAQSDRWVISSTAKVREQGDEMYKTTKTMLSLATVMVAMPMLIVAAVGATSASAALPEFVNSKGPLGSGTKVSFKSTGGEGHLTTAGGTEVKCKSSVATGEIEGPNMIKKTVVTYKECESSGFSCESEIGSGTIVTASIQGLLVYLKKSKGLPAGVHLEPESGSEFAKFSCFLVSATVTGHLIGEVPAASTNKLSTTGELVFKATSAGKQRWTKIEEGSEEHHLTALSEPAALEVTETLTFKEAIEVKA